MNYKRHEVISLKSHPAFNERWVQDRIEEDPSILGLGELQLIARERQQEHAGRLDLLLGSAEDATRYEVELMLGSTDPSHIVRCIEYWDIERRRYPAYDHCAVIIAEDITSRFLNVISLLSGTIPLVAIQLSALRIGEHVALHFAKVLDQRALRSDDASDVDDRVASRQYWIQRSSQPLVEMTDQYLTLINEIAPQKYQLNYRMPYIGLSDGIRSRNFILFKPRKRQLYVVMQSGWTEEMRRRLEEAGLEPDQSRGRLIFKLSPSDLARHMDLVRKITGEFVAKVHE
jgi:hypothetical protein